MASTSTALPRGKRGYPVDTQEPHGLLAWFSDAGYENRRSTHDGIPTPVHGTPSTAANPEEVRMFLSAGSDLFVPEYRPGSKAT